MTLKSYLWGMRVSTVFVLVGWIFVVNYIDPEKSGILGQVIFYLVTFLMLAGVFSLFLTGLRKRQIEKDETDAGTSFRQGALLSILAVTLLFFQQMGILVWWDSLLVAVGILLIELFFLSKK